MTQGDSDMESEKDKIYMYNMIRVRSHIRIDFVICISNSKYKKIVTAIIVIGRYCLYVPTKHKA